MAISGVNWVLLEIQLKSLALLMVSVLCLTATIFLATRM